MRDVKVPARRRVRLPAALFAALGLVSLLLGALPAVGQEDILRIEASLRPKSLSRGEEGAVVLKVILQPGLYISPHPAFTIEFTTSKELIFPKDVYTHSDLNMEVLEEGGQQFLNVAKPIEIPFTVSLDALRGGHILEGRIKYFACSKKEGWCLKNTARFSIPFFTRQTVKSKGH